MTDHRPNIVLTGFMGTGKSTVGRMLARRLDLEFVDTDDLIEERHGPIPTIFEAEGEAAFRRYERLVATELAGRRGLVVATGGRLLLDPVNAAALGASGRVFCLVATVETIADRIVGSATARPLLTGGDPVDRIRALLAERAAAYGRFEQVATDGLDPAQVAHAVVARLTED